jgi:protein dithiol oxidoreductase (disulfide-forming)
MISIRYGKTHMNRFRSLLPVLLSILGLVTAASALAQPALDKEYRLINPPQVSSTKGVEVLEFFNYACGHCYEFEPLLKAWLKNKPKDAEFRYVPAVFNENMLPLAKLHYSLEEMGVLDQIHGRVYTAIHVQNQKLVTREAIVKWVGGQGLDAEKFAATFDSFSVANKAQRASQLTRSMRVPGTPYLVVGGRYLTGPSMVLKPGSGGVDANRFVTVLDELIDMARSAK